MAVTGLAHVNINCSDYERSKEFYELLGFKEFWKVPETNRPEIAAAVGMPPYRVRGALLVLDGIGPGGARPLTIDLLQWLEPHDDAPPYGHLYHYGIARVALTTDDLDGDVEKLKAAGVEFLSDPVALTTDTASTADTARTGDAASTVRFVCFEDPDGTVLELVEY